MTTPTPPYKIVFYDHTGARDVKIGEQTLRNVDRKLARKEAENIAELMAFGDYEGDWWHWELVGTTPPKPAKKYTAMDWIAKMQMEGGY